MSTSFGILPTAFCPSSCLSRVVRNSRSKYPDRQLFVKSIQSIRFVPLYRGRRDVYICCSANRLVSETARNSQSLSTVLNLFKETIMSKLTGKVAVVTGASKGIGAAIAKSLADEGASVVVNYASSKSGAETVVAAITTAGGKAVAVGGDVSKAAEAQGIIDAAIKNYGRLDILVNNSGVYEFAPIEAVTEEQFHRIFNINVLGLLLTTQAAVKHLGEGSSIINVGSVVSRITPPGTSVYT